MKIPTILKGDDAGAITLSLDSSHTYLNAVLVVAYQGVTKTFSGLSAGGTVSLVYTHDDTASFRLGCYPIEARLIGRGGSVETVSNAEWRIKVTDILAEVNRGGSFEVVPGSASVPVTDIDEIGDRYKLPDLAAKVNEICRVLAQRTTLALAIAFAAFGAFAASVQTARLDDVYNDAQVVTNVTFDTAPDYSTSNAVLVATIEATAPAPGNYANVSNAAMNAVQPESLPALDGYSIKRCSTNLTLKGDENIGVGRTMQLNRQTYEMKFAGWHIGLTEEFLDSNASKADVEEGWWSKWTYSGLPDGWCVTIIEYEGNNQWYFEASENIVPEGAYGYADGGEDATTLLFANMETQEYGILNVTATRHRVAAPVPTNPEDIGAASPGTVSNIVTKAYVEGLGISSEESDPSIGLTNGTIYVKGSTITPLTGYTESDPTISAWAKAASKPTYTAAEVGATTPEDVTAAIREQSLGGIWDAELEVWWTPRMRNGSLTYEATTNVNLNAVN